jgi:putative colanic acid biosynthesis acetyltransferase WcaF
MNVKLSTYNNSWYSPGASAIKRTLWYFVNAIFINSYLFPINSFKILLLRLFDASIGKGVVIKPNVNVKYPWLLKIGDYCWIGENVWIDNLASIQMGSNCVLSQGAMLLTGNHNYKKTTFDLLVGSITLEDGVWIGARSMVGPGVTCKNHSVLSANSFATRDMSEFTIYAGSPAIPVKKRIFENQKRNIDQ